VGRVGTHVRAGVGVAAGLERGRTRAGGIATVSSATAGGAPIKRRSTSTRSTAGSVASRHQRQAVKPLWAAACWASWASVRCGVAIATVSLRADPVVRTVPEGSGRAKGSLTVSAFPTVPPPPEAFPTILILNLFYKNHLPCSLSFSPPTPPLSQRPGAAGGSGGDCTACEYTHAARRSGVLSGCRGRGTPVRQWWRLSRR
jgi:hypothetical protein